tara:strand:- start:809 stop:1468 length:660 start_codon:yes stop_codon:yes gene_type:complete
VLLCLSSVHFCVGSSGALFFGVLNIYTQSNVCFLDRGLLGVVMSKYTDEVKRLVLASLRAGQTHVVAARTAGITVQTLYKWLKDPTKSDFRAQVEKSEAIAEQALVAIVQQHAETDWRSAKWLLTRRYPHWREQAYTRQETRDRLDELRVKKAQLEVEYAELRLAAANSTGGDEELLAVLNTPILLEEKVNAEVREKEGKEGKKERGSKGGGGRSLRAS